jgi:hypothetical protein
MIYRYVAEPHPHLAIDEIASPDDYAAMRFPDSHLQPDAAWGLTAADPAYASVFRDPLWRALRDEICGERFVGDVLQAFAADMRGAGCLVDPGRARLTSFVESREEKQRVSLAAGGDPNALFTRLDFQSKGAGAYREFVHLDWPRRIVGGILFFCDADEEGLVGGETALYRDLEFADDRWCHVPELTSLFRPAHNTGVIFLNSNRGFHGPRAITALRGRRRWLYYTISSRCDIWPCAARAQLDREPAASQGVKVG